MDKYLYSPAFYKTTGTASYTVRFKEVRRFFPKSVQLDLTIDNFLNRGAPVYGSSGTTSTAFSGAALLVPRNNDINNPSRVVATGNPTCLAPRNYMLSATMAF